MSTGSGQDMSMGHDYGCSSAHMPALAQPRQSVEWPSLPALCPQMPPLVQYLGSCIPEQHVSFVSFSIHNCARNCPCLCRKVVPVQKYNNVKNHNFTLKAQLTYCEKLRKETEQRFDDIRVNSTKWQQRALNYEAQFQQNLQPQFMAMQWENAQQKEQIEALQRANAQ